MRAFRALGILRLVLLLCGIGIWLFGLPKTATAQGQNIVDDQCVALPNGGKCDVEDYAAILASTNSGEIDTYVNTYIWNYYYFLDYFAHVTGNLLENNNQVDSKTGFDDGSGNAQVNMYDTVHSGSTYELDGSHELDDIDEPAPIMLPPTRVTVYLGPPHIDSSSPTYGFVGTNGAITIKGKGLVDPFSQSEITIQARRI